MDHFKEKLELLNHIQENPEATQRELMEKLDISLGKVNFLIKALTQKGIIKLKRFKNSRNKKAYLYIITPEGVKEKSWITREFLKRKVEEYNTLKEEITRLKEEIDTAGKTRERILLEPTPGNIEDETRNRLKYLARE
ncbi:MarR family EPS-associated transcriptional regulator [Candidatus Omnitrophota bacterium]